MKNNIDRRIFIKQGVMTSGGILLSPSLLSASSLYSNNEKSEASTMNGLTPITVIENACMLAYCSGRLSLKSQEVVTTDIHLRNTSGNKGRLAVILPSQNEKIYDLLRLIKSNDEIKFIKEKRAIAFGWAAVNAVERNINSLFQNKNNEDILNMRMHQDAIIIRSMSTTDSKPGPSDAEDIEKLLNVMQARTITRVHTLKPDPDDGIGWVNRMSEWRRENHERMKMFADIIVNPISEKAGPSFYSASDIIIDISLKLQNGEKVYSDTILDALKNTTGSNYSKALIEATNDILTIDAFLENELTEQELFNKLYL